MSDPRQRQQSGRSGDMSSPKTADDRERNRGWPDPNHAGPWYPGGNKLHGWKSMGGGGGGLGGPANNWIGSFQDLVNHEMGTNCAPAVIQNALKVGLAEGLIKQIGEDLYDFSGMKHIPMFGGYDMGWTHELNLGTMMWEYEDTRDLGSDETYRRYERSSKRNGSK